MRTSLIIIAVSAVSVLSTMLVLERSYSHYVERAVSYTLPDQAAVQAAALSDVDDATQTADVQ